MVLKYKDLRYFFSLCTVWILFFVISFRALGSETKNVAGRNITEDEYTLLRQYGNFTLAYSQFQPGLKFFKTKDGMIAYEDHFERVLVLGDPMGENPSELLSEFMKVFENPFFCGVTEKTAPLLADRGFLINAFGKDPSICVQTYDLEGSQKQKLRQAWKKFQGMDLDIIDGSEDSSLFEKAAKDITTHWVQQKVNSDKEVRFLTRPISYTNEKDVRKFFVKNEAGEVVALYYFDPIYEAGEVVGYSTSFKRRFQHAMTGLEEAMIIWAIHRFREEGKRILNLGMIPLYKIEETIPYKGSYFIAKDLLGIREKGDRSVYNFKGLADFKHRFRGAEHPVYLASKLKDATKDTLALFYALKNLPKEKESLENLQTSLQGSNVEDCRSAFKNADLMP